jgi:hypothetical protein
MSHRQAGIAAPGAGALVIALLLMLAPSTLCAQPVLAYLDPGTGSVVLQMVVGGLLGAALTIKIFWRRILAFFQRSGNRPSDTP